ERPPLRIGVACIERVLCELIRARQEQVHRVEEKFLSRRMGNVSEPAEAIRARARLALRAEKAFGLDALPIRLEQPVENTSKVAQSEEPDRIVNEKPQPSPAPVVEARKAIVNLFGSAETPAKGGASNGAFTAPVASPEEKRRRLAELDAKVKVCK